MAVTIPTEAEARLARESARRLSPHLGSRGEGGASVSVNGETVAIPPSAARLLGAILGVTGEGRGVGVARPRTRRATRTPPSC